MKPVYRAVETCRSTIMQNSIPSRRIFSSLLSIGIYSTPLSLASTLLAALLLIGCQSAPPAHPPPRPVTSGGKTQETIIPSRRTISPGAWKADADRWAGVKYRKGGMDRSGIDCSGLAAQMYLAVTGISTLQSSQRVITGRVITRAPDRPSDETCLPCCFTIWS